MFREILVLGFASAAAHILPFLVMFTTRFNTTVYRVKPRNSSTSRPVKPRNTFSFTCAELCSTTGGHSCGCLGGKSRSGWLMCVCCGACGPGIDWWSAFRERGMVLVGGTRRALGGERRRRWRECGVVVVEDEF